MIVADSIEIFSASKTCFSSSLARAALFVFLSVPSPLASAHGNGPSVGGGKGHHSYIDGGSLPPGPCGRRASCQPAE